MKLLKPETKHIDYDVTSVRVEHDLLKSFDVELEKQGISRSEAIRQLIIFYMEQSLKENVK